MRQGIFLHPLSESNLEDDPEKVVSNCLRETKTEARKAFNKSVRDSKS